MPIKNEYQVTQKQWTKWLWESTCADKKKLAFFIMWCVLGVAAFGAGVYFLLTHTDTTAQIVDTVILFLLFILCLSRSVIRLLTTSRKQYKTYAKAYSGENWTRSIRFQKEEILVLEGNTKVKCNYADIEQIVERKADIWLIFSNRMRLRLYRDAFTGGDWAACQKWIASKRKTEG